MSNTYYVYAYLREDGTPYYIGKGKGKRITAPHNIAVPKESNRRLKLSQNLTEEQAHQLEIELIAHYGRKDNGTGILRNLTDGGEGTSGWIPADSTKQKISESRKGKTYEEIMNLETAQNLKQRLAELIAVRNPGKSEKSRERAREFMTNTNPSKDPAISSLIRNFQLSLGDKHPLRSSTYRAAQSKKMSGDGNIAKRDDIRQKISDNNPMKNLEHLNKIRGDNHYSKAPGYSSPLKWRLCCVVCRKDTTISGLARHHKHGASQ